MTRILVAGIGNIFLGDDGFGPAVARRLVAMSWPDDVRIADFGIRGLDLAYALTSGVDAAILVDAVARGGEPGTLYMIAPAVGEEAAAGAAAAPALIDGHAMDPVQVLRLAAQLGALPALVRVVGCEPTTCDEDSAFALSDVVAAAVEPAAAMVADLVAAMTWQVSHA